MLGLLQVKRGPADPGARRLLYHEHRLLQRLQGLDGCPRVVRFDPETPELVTAALDGLPLGRSGLPGKLDLSGFLALAGALARLLAALHGRGVIHRNLNPETLLVRPDDLSVGVTRFELATTFGSEPTAEPPGSLAYASPEQTGRMNRPVDARSDLYCLGATLYQLATGEPPFDEPSPLGLVHAHLARRPCPPEELVPWMPPKVSEVLLALLAKEPDERYQSAAGLARDLEALRQALASGSSLEAVALRQHDLPLAPRPAVRLRGREGELARLQGAVERAARGEAAALFVAGPAGLGKTSVCREVARLAALRRGLFVTGKFEQLSGDRPFRAPAQALAQLGELLLAHPPEHPSEWRRAMGETLGPDAGALGEVLPDLEALVGPQEPPARLGPDEERLRLRHLALRFLKGAASSLRPLVLFLDDLQWADQSSLDFLGALLEEPELPGLLVLGAFRDSEASSPLGRMLARPTPSGTPPEVLVLDRLAPVDLGALAGDLLQLDDGQARQLGEVLHQKTGGNPFFAIELVHSLHREGLLVPDPERGTWTWDPQALENRVVSGDVVDFLVESLADLPDSTSAILAAAAGLGHSWTLGFLARATGEEPAALADRLTPAFERGILLTPEGPALSRGEETAVARFCHDQMQRAVYRSREEAWWARQHLAMARRLARGPREPALEFLAAEQYAASLGLVESPEERREALALLRSAALRARHAGSFDIAERLLRRGLELEEAAEDFELREELHVLLYCQARLEEADEAYGWLAAHAPTPAALLEPASLQVMSLSNRTRYAEGIELGSALLARLGMPVPTEDPLPDLRLELGRLYQHVEAGALDRLPRNRASEEGDVGARSRLMNRMIPAAFFSSPLLACWMAVRLGRQWMEEGYLEACLYPMSCLILATIPLRGDHATGYRAATRALEIGRELERGVETARTEHVAALVNLHWFEPLEASLPMAHSAFGALRRTTELEFACYTFFTSQAAVLDTCGNLSELDDEVSEALRVARRLGNRHAEPSFQVFQQLLRALRGDTASAGSFDDGWFEEDAHLAAIQGNPMARVFFHVYRALAAELFGQEEDLVRHAEAAEPLTAYITGFYPTALANLLHSLALLQRLRRAPDPERSRLLELLGANQDWLAARAADAPMNYLHLHDLVEAERLDALDRPWEALGAFERAMRRAQGHHRPWHRARITERAGLCHLRRGLVESGRGLLARAHDLYEAWGASGKAAAMRREMPFLRSAAEGAPEGAGGRLVLEGVLRASQALASETSLPHLVDRLVEILGQLTGATGVRLLVDHEGEWYLEGGRTGQDPLPRMPLAEAERRLLVSASGFRLSTRTGRALVSEDAVVDARFRGEPYFAGLTVCSLLALPIRVQGRLRGLLVLENRLYRGAFTAEGIELLEMLGEQVAISIENGMLYRSLEQKVAERTRDLEERTREAEAALARVRKLEGILPICMGCKKIRDDQDQWSQLERYISQHSDASFSHGLCPECYGRMSAEVDEIPET